MGLRAELRLANGAVYQGERLVYRLVNTGLDAIVFNEAYELQRLTRDGWRDVEVGPFRLNGYVLHPGAWKEMSFRVSLGEPVGRHRMLKEIRYDLEGAARAGLATPRAPAPVWLEATFEVFGR